MDKKSKMILPINAPYPNSLNLEMPNDNIWKILYRNIIDATMEM